MAATEMVVVVLVVIVGIGIGMALGVMIGRVWSENARVDAVGKLLEAQEKRDRERGGKPVLSDVLMAELLTRLMDASLPKVEHRPPADDEGPGHDAEYEAPVEEVGDWTEQIAYLNPQRQDWMGVGPGEGVPGLDVPVPESGEVLDWRLKGEEMFESWVEPVDLGNGDVVE